VNAMANASHDPPNAAPGWAVWLLRMLGWLPLTWAQAMGGWLGLLTFWSNGRSREVTDTNLALCFPEMPTDERRRLSRQAFRETGRGLAEMGAMWTWDAERLRDAVVEVRGRELLDAAVASGRGVLIAAPHLGCWELTSHYAQLHGLRLTALFRPPRQSALGPLVRASRERFGARLVPTAVSGIRELHRALRRGECVGILPDQDPGSTGGVFAPFFGVPTATMPLFGRLARQSGAVLLVAYAERLAGGRYRLHLKAGDERMRDADPLVAATALNAAVEACVREVPAQYLWIYRRFKSRPDGVAPRYRPRRRRGSG